ARARAPATTRVARRVRRPACAARRLNALEGDVPVLAARVLLALVLQHLEAPRDQGAGVFGPNHLVDEAELRRLVGAREQAPVILDELLAPRLRIVAVGQL